MNILLDTHALIWFITDNDKLPIKTKKIIESKENRCYVSIASLWEMGIKNSIGRLELNINLDDIFSTIEKTGFDILPITTQHILKNSELEFFHQDPFDRIIIAQSIVENIDIITIDKKFSNYNVSLVWKK